jgi:FKBP-type peptidyl-prolyl cis-trans isomerase
MRPRNRRIHLVATLLGVLVLSACGDEITFPPEFDDSLGIDLATMTKTASGLYYRDLVMGTGKTAKAGDLVTVPYTLWLPNGQRLDSGTYPFTLGAREAIPGFDEGVMGMAVGGKRKLVVHPDLAYGAQGQGGIGPNQTLVFEVELQKIG